jgi:hypothetical protein
MDFLSALSTIGWVFVGNLTVLSVRINTLIANQGLWSGGPTWPRNSMLPKRYYQWSFWLARLSLGLCAGLTAVAWGISSPGILLEFGMGFSPFVLLVNRQLALRLFHQLQRPLEWDRRGDNTDDDDDNADDLRMAS